MSCGGRGLVLCVCVCVCGSLCSDGEKGLGGGGG